MDDQTSGYDQTGRATATPPELDIPILRKKEKERKGVGAVLPGAAVEGGQVAAVGAGGQAGGLLALFSGKLGLVALALGVAGAGAVGVGVLRNRAAAGHPSSALALSAPTDSLSVARRDAYGSKSLSYMAQAGAGQLKWADPNAPKPAVADKKADAPADTPEAKAAADKGAGQDDGGQAADRPRLTGGLSGAHLTASLGGSSAFGSKSIFARGDGFNMKRMNLQARSDLGASRLASAQKGRLGVMHRNVSSHGASAMNTSKIVSGRALGQLKFAGNRSQMASAAGQAGAASSYAADAFDQQKTNGGQLAADSGAIGQGLGTVNAPGTGAPDVTGGNGTGACPSGWTPADGGGCTPPDINNGKAMTDYQNLLDGVLALQKAAQNMMMIGTALLVIGAVMVATGFLSAVGWALIAAGAAMLVMSMMMNKQADQMANQIGSMYQQKKQADILKARGSGDSSTPELQNQSVSQAVQAEQSSQPTDAGAQGNGQATGPSVDAGAGR